MRYDRDKVLTVMTANKAKIDQQGWFADNPKEMENIFCTQLPKTLNEVRDWTWLRRFSTGGDSFALFYPAPELQYRPFTHEEFKPFRNEWFTLKGPEYITFRSSVIDYSEKGIVLSDATSEPEDIKSKFYSWKEFLDQFTLDGTPCGMGV